MQITPLPVNIFILRWIPPEKPDYRNVAQSQYRAKSHTPIRRLLNSRLALRVAAWDVPRTGTGTA